MKNILEEELKTIVNKKLGYARSIARTLKELTALAEKYGITKGSITEADIDSFYNELEKVYGIGKKLKNLIMYDLIRIYYFPVPSNLELLDEIQDKLKKLGISTSHIDRKDYPYIDAALYDLSI